VPTTKTQTNVPSWVGPAWASDQTWERTPIWDAEFADRWRKLHGQGEESKPPVVKRPTGRKPRPTR
jgi:hypothetical protein